MQQFVPEIKRAEIEYAAQLLRAGRLVAFPTETVYGLGANALDAEAVARIYAVKGRPATSPLIVHVASAEIAQSLVAVWPDTAQRLTKKFWPGPLTLVLPVPRREMDLRPVERDPAALQYSTVPPIVTAGLPTVGLRMPAHPLALALIRASGVPIAAPSANRFTQLSPTTADHVRASLGPDVDYILDGGSCQVGIESTVLSLAGPRPILLRPGGVSRPQIEALIGPICAGSQFTGAHPAPGMHPRHYSPRTALLLVTAGSLPEHGQGIYLQYLHPPNRTDLAARQMPYSASDYAAALYCQLHEADAGNYDWIAVDVPPSGPDWEAVHDRLRRAASNA